MKLDKRIPKNPEQQVLDQMRSDFIKQGLTGEQADSAVEETKKFVALNRHQRRAHLAQLRRAKKK